MSDSNTDVTPATKVSKKPRLQTIVSIGEIISAIAIVVSVLYVANQFSRSQTLTSREVENIVYDRMLEMDRLMIENADFAEVLTRAATDPDALSDSDLMRFLAYEHIFYDSWESAWYYHEEGILEEEAWNGWDDWFFSEAKRRPAFGWMGNRRHFAGGFLEHVDRQLVVDSVIIDK